MTFRRGVTFCLSIGAMFLASCGNDDKRINPKDVTTALSAAVRESVNPTPKVDREALLVAAGQRALARTSPDEPVATVQFKTAGIVSLLREIESKGPHTVWAARGTDDRRSIVTKDGMIVATRGLRKDLMSAEADSVLALVRSREEGTVPYTQRYIDGDFNALEAKSTCTVSRGYDKVVDLESGPSPVLQMFSSCVSVDRQFVDLFLVDTSGRIVEMRQWVGPVLGFAHLKQLR